VDGRGGQKRGGKKWRKIRKLSKLPAGLSWHMAGLNISAIFLTFVPCWPKQQKKEAK
jgi:hypothetical protein